METKILQSQTVFHGKVFDVRQEAVELPNGKTARIDIVAHEGAVTILPVDAEGRIWFVRQYRHPAHENLLELPAGVMDAGEQAEDSARREVREEIGMAAGQLKKIGEFYLAPGYSTELMSVFLAHDLHPSPLEQDEDEFIDIEKIPVAQAFHLAKTGQLRDAKTLAALFLAQPYFE